jgi:hypothetical protein
MDQEGHRDEHERAVEGVPVPQVGLAENTQGRVKSSEEETRESERSPGRECGRR